MPHPLNKREKPEHMSPDAASHGKLVSALAKTGVGGKAVSALASSKNDDKRQARRAARRNRLRNLNG